MDSFSRILRRTKRAAFSAPSQTFQAYYFLCAPWNGLRDLRTVHESRGHAFLDALLEKWGLFASHRPCSRASSLGTAPESAQSIFGLWCSSEHKQLQWASAWHSQIESSAKSRSQGSIRVSKAWQTLTSCRLSSVTQLSSSQEDPPAPQCSSSSSISSRNKPLSFCVVGSGPAGFYTVDKLLKAFPAAHVTLLERLPSPFGLVRTGVAPDHPETKLVTNQFTRVASNDRCSYLGNVRVGSDVTLNQLRSFFHAVILAFGAEGDRRLGIEGEGLSNSLSAREFVWWYNGHPEYVHLPVDLTTSDTAVVFGQGNVALDVARILVRSRAELAATDIAEHALEALRGSRIETVHLIGRRGPVQAACTAKEVRELLGLEGVTVTLNHEELTTSPIDEEEMRSSRARRRVYELLGRAVDARSAAGLNSPRVNLQFFRSPARIHPPATLPGEREGGSVGEVVVEKTVLAGGGQGKPQRAVGTGVMEDIPCGLVLRSIGYKSLPIEGLPFDSLSGTVPNLAGRVTGSSTSSEACGEARGEPPAEMEGTQRGLYVVGWLKRGPTGIIGTNEIDAAETVGSIVEDAERGLLAQPAGASAAGRAQSGHAELQALLGQQGLRLVTFDDWLRIDGEEVRRGKAAGKPREKIVSVEEMLRLVGQ